MSTCPIPPTTRPLRVDEATVFIALPLRSGTYTVDPPVTCLPGRQYLAHLDADTMRATITEATPCPTS